MNPAQSKLCMFYFESDNQSRCIIHILCMAVNRFQCWMLISVDLPYQE